MAKPYNDFVSNYYAYVLCSFFFCDTWLLSVSEPYPELQPLHHCKINMIMLQENTLQCLSINVKRLLQINWWFVIGFATTICNSRIWWMGALYSILSPGTFQPSVMMSYLQYVIISQKLFCHHPHNMRLKSHPMKWPWSILLYHLWYTEWFSRVVSLSLNRWTSGEHFPTALFSDFHVTLLQPLQHKSLLKEMHIFFLFI